MDRSNQYERASRRTFSIVGFVYVAVDETNRSLSDDVAIKSLDFIVHGTSGAGFLVDVKGRRFPGGKPGKERRVWECWSTLEDIDGLDRWSDKFGPDYRGLLVFAYRLAKDVTLPAETEDLWDYRGRRFLFRRGGGRLSQGDARPQPEVADCHAAVRRVSAGGEAVVALHRSLGRQPGKRRRGKRGSLAQNDSSPLRGVGRQTRSPDHAMKIGLRLESLNLPLRRAMAVAEQIGVHGVQFDAVGDLAPEQLSQTGRRELRNRLRGHDLELTAIGCPMRRGLSVPENLEARLDHVRQVMQMAFDLGPRIAIVEAGKIADDVDSPANAMLRESLLVLGQAGDHIGTVLRWRRARSRARRWRSSSHASTRPGSARTSTPPICSRTTSTPTTPSGG